MENDRFPKSPCFLISSFIDFGAFSCASLSRFKISRTGVPCSSSGPFSPFDLLMAADSSLIDGRVSVFGPFLSVDTGGSFLVVKLETKA